MIQQVNTPLRTAGNDGSITLLYSTELELLIFFAEDMGWVRMRDMLWRCHSFVAFDCYSSLALSEISL